MRQDSAYLLDMIAAARKTSRFAQDIDYDRFARSELHQNAILKVLEVVGEAASRLSDDTKSAHPEIPWAKIVGLRNRIVHGYFEVNLEVVWNIVKTDIPSLIRQLEEIVPREAE